MKAPPQKCALCLKTKQLQDSHFFPANIYKVARASRHKNPNPFFIGSEAVTQTSTQAKQRLLCWDCEQRFHQNGEDHVARFCFKGSGHFVLRSLLLNATPLEGGTDDTEYFAAKDISGFDFRRFTYFAASIIWRAAVTDWKAPGGKYERLSLGASYLEEFRQYLRGEEDFPKFAAIQVVVSTAEWPSVMALWPHSERDAGYYVHRFLIPGIDFLMFVGKKIPANQNAVCLYRSADHPVFFSDLVDKWHKNLMTKYVASRFNLTKGIMTLKEPVIVDKQES